MENNHTDIGRFHEAPPPRPEAAKPVEKLKRLERVSITEWMAQTLDEMKRRVGWFKQNPEVTRIQRLAAGQPEVKQHLDQRLAKVERQADEALAEAREELEHVIESPTPIEVVKTERYLTPVTVDMNNKEAWQEYKYHLIKEFDRSFANLAPREGDFEVKLSAPLSTTPLSELRDRGPVPVRVRSESVAGVRMDAIITPPNSDKVGEYRIYGLDGHYKPIPGDQDPVEALIDQARTNQITFENWKKAEAKARETQAILLGDRGSLLKKFETPITLKELVKKRGATLGSIEEYTKTPERMLKVTQTKGREEPEVGALKYSGRREPVVDVGQGKGEWVGTQPEIERQGDRFSEAIKAKYGPDVASRLEEHLFANQDLYDQYFQSWERASRDTNLKPEQQELAKKVFAALQTEGKERGLGGKNSYAYIVESYKNQENDLPKLKESILTVQEILADPTTPEADKATYKKELNYLNHLKTRVEQNPKQTLHRAVEKFLERNQYVLSLSEIREITQAEQELDNAENVEEVREKVAKAMDYAGRIVLDRKLEKFIKDYARHLRPGEKGLLEEKREAIKNHPDTINYWQEDAEISEALSSVKRRSWDRIVSESLTRLNQALKRYGNEMDEEAYPVVNKLRTQLQNGFRTGVIDINVMQDILRRFEPAEFEQYVTSLLSAATGQDMRPDWERTDKELKPPTVEAPKSDTWVHEVPIPSQSTENTIGRTGIQPLRPEEVRNETIVPERPTPVMVEWEPDEDYEDVSGEIPGLIRSLRSVQDSAEDARVNANRAREILEQAGSDEMIEVTRPMLQNLDNLRSRRLIDDRVYRRALATLISADSFNAREQAISTLKMDLPLPLMHQPGKMRPPVPDEIPQEKKPGKQAVA